MLSARIGPRVQYNKSAEHVRTEPEHVEHVGRADWYRVARPKFSVVHYILYEERLKSLKSLCIGKCDKIFQDGTFRLSFLDE